MTYVFSIFQYFKELVSVVFCYHFRKFKLLYSCTLCEVITKLKINYHPYAFIVYKYSGMCNQYTAACI